MQAERFRRVGHRQGVDERFVVIDRLAARNFVTYRRQQDSERAFKNSELSSAVVTSQSRRLSKSLKAVSAELVTNA